MLYRLIILTILVLAAFFAHASSARASDAKDPFAKPEEREQQQVVTIQGEHISQIFVSACSENSFADFQAWSQRNHFMIRQFDSPAYQVSSSEIKDDELLFSVKINSQNMWEATIRDQKFVGQDPCETAMAYLSTRDPKPLTKKVEERRSLSQRLLNFALPEARAERLVNELTTTNWLLGALATAAITDGKFIESLAAKFTLSNSYLLMAAFRATDTANLNTATTNLEQLLTQAPEFICSHNRTKIFGAASSHIIVKKGYVPNRLGFENNQTEKPLKNENLILASGKVHDHLISLAQRCNQEADATLINSQLQAERETLNRKIVRVNQLNRVVSSESEPQVQSGSK